MKRLWFILLVLVLLGPTGFPEPTTTYAQSGTPNFSEEAQRLFEQMTPAERVAQLFLITFRGNQIQVGSPLYDLLTRNGIGGVVLLSGNDNFTDEQNLPRQVGLLTNTLQELVLQGESPGVIDPSSEEDSEATPVPTPAPRPGAVPLWIGSLLHGNGREEIRSGVSDLPSLMAIGATWSREQAQRSGSLAGLEFSAMGFNLLVGPSLNILDNQTVFTSNGIGTASFGGSPYWVGELGQAYLNGLEEGSDGRLAVIATGFPGSGSSDRPLDLEIATVRKSLADLQRNELLPFAAAARPANGQAAMDGVMTAHLRYEGFQGSIRASTPPISFDPQALETLLNLPEFSGWRAQGGLVISPPLGGPAIQRFFGATTEDFPHRQVAKDAFLAGNDLLYIDEFGPIGAEINAGSASGSATR